MAKSCEGLAEELVKCLSESDCVKCVAVEAVVELDLVTALKVPVFPEVIFTKAGKIIYREKDELSKMMAFFYYGAAKPPYLDEVGDNQELIPSVQI